MNTAPEILVPCGSSDRTAMNARTISQASRLRVKPSRPVAQNAHCIAQPTCDDKQMVNRPSLCSGIRTASCNAPSGERSRYLTKPSASSTTRSTISSCSSRVCARIAARTVARTGFFIVVKSDLPSETTCASARRASAALHSTPTLCRCCASSSGLIPTRAGLITNRSVNCRRQIRNDLLRRQTPYVVRR
jgi:hypothetical protein